MERMASQPEDNLLPQRRQEEPQRDKVSADGQDPLPQRRWEKPRLRHDRVDGQNPPPQRRQEEPRRDNASVSRRKENHSHIGFIATIARRTQTHVSWTVIRSHTSHCDELPHGEVREGEHPLKIIKLREPGSNLGSQKVFLMILVAIGCRIGQGRFAG